LDFPSASKPLKKIIKAQKPENYAQIKIFVNLPPPFRRYVFCRRIVTPFRRHVFFAAVCLSFDAAFFIVTTSRRFVVTFCRRSICRNIEISEYRRIKFGGVEKNLSIKSVSCAKKGKK